MNFDTKKIDEIIVGRVIPHIYAFSTNTIPNYLKVGDTYRTVESRLKEWKKYFPQLNKEYEKKAVINDSNYFRDYAVHKFLESKKGRTRLQPSDLPTGVYYSNEFFKNANGTDIDEAFADIIRDFESNGNEYDFYDLLSKQQISISFERNQKYCLRPNQKEVVDNFMKAYKKGRTNLLMYAVMRFGKSFTSLCCAKEMKAKIVVVVSGKADVEIEWKRTCESHTYFADYIFITSKELARDPKSISNALKYKKKVVVFLTLQDLSGKVIKNKHEDIFTKQIDLLIVDETHFGARADEYGKVLQDVKIKEYNDTTSSEEAEEIYKYLNRKVTLHLSGTPYRLLMGSEFKKEDIICFCQFTDIIKEQTKWDEKWLLKDLYDSKECEEFGKKIGDSVHEWDNPYYGFPQMVRFAFNPDENTQKRLEEIKNNGESYAFSKLFRPQSIEKNDQGEHKKFIYETEVLDLIKCIDGSKNDDNIFPFLNYDKIKEGKMCRHMVMVLPYCASCDAMEELIKKHKQDFINLKNYEIINISGVDNVKKYKKTSDIIKTISENEENNKKTITLTVQRMLTGSTVKEWDTMIFLKDTSSPQEYDQAIFRLQNQYVETRIDEKTGDTVKINLKPQTLLIDFAPNRMFYMQEKKAQIYNANIDESGNKKLRDRIEYELKISPIIIINKNKLLEVKETDILEAIANYNYDRGISEEAKEISIDLAILDNSYVKAIIECESEIDSNAGLETKANEGEETELDTDKDEDEESQEDNKGDDSNNDDTSSKDNANTSDIAKSIKKIQNYYRRILLFSFLTKDKVTSLDDIIMKIEKKENPRLAKNLGISKNILVELRKSFKNKFALSSLDYKIQNMNDLSNSNNISNVEKVNLAMNKFGKLGESIVVTPNHICDKMTSLLKNNISSILDIGSVCGEMALSIYKNKSKMKNKIYTIPKNNISYELCRKTYELLSLDLNNIASFSCFDLLDLIKNDKYNDANYYIPKKNNFSSIIKSDLKHLGGNESMRFDAVVGNPPYQSETKVNSVNGQNPRTNIFQYFQIQANNLAMSQCVLIYPGIRWIHRSGKGLKEFGKELINDLHLSKIIFYPNASEVFDKSGIADGISIVNIDKNKTTNGFEYEYIEGNKCKALRRDNPGEDLMLIDPNYIDISNKIKNFVKNNNYKYLSDAIYSRSLFGIESGFAEDNPEKVKLFTSQQLSSNEIKVLINDKKGSAGRSVWFVTDKSNITSNSNMIYEWQVVVSSAHPGGQEGRDNQLEIIDNKSAFGRSRLALKSFKTQEEALNFYKYAKTKIIRFSFLLSDESLTSLAKFVPDIIDYKNTNTNIDFNNNIDEQLRKKIGLTDDEMAFINNLIK